MQYRIKTEARSQTPSPRSWCTDSFGSVDQLYNLDSVYCPQVHFYPPPLFRVRLSLREILECNRKKIIYVWLYISIVEPSTRLKMAEPVFCFGEGDVCSLRRVACSSEHETRSTGMRAKPAHKETHTSTKQVTTHTHRASARYCPHLFLLIRNSAPVHSHSPPLSLREELLRNLFSITRTHTYTYTHSHAHIPTHGLPQ